MKALSVHPYYAMQIMGGLKTIECRTWKTKYRGDILICSTAAKMPGTIPGHALCVAELVDIVPFTKKHLKDAGMNEMPDRPSYAWVLDNIRLIYPVQVKGKQSIWTYDGEVTIAPDLDNAKEATKWVNKYVTPLLVAVA